MAQAIRDVMTPDPIRLPADTSVQDAARKMRDEDVDDTVKDATQLMKDKALRRIPVVEPGDGGKVVGIVSLGDIAVEKHPKSALGQISAASANT